MPSDLVERLRRGDDDAYREAVALHGNGLYSFLLRLCGQRELAEDLFQETWLALARHAVKLPPDTRLAPWLYAVARNAYRSHRRWAWVDVSRWLVVDHDDTLASCEASPEQVAVAGQTAVDLDIAPCKGYAPPTARSCCFMPSMGSMHRRWRQSWDSIPTRSGNACRVPEKRCAHSSIGYNKESGHEGHALIPSHPCSPSAPGTRGSERRDGRAADSASSQAAPSAQARRRPRPLPLLRHSPRLVRSRRRTPSLILFPLSRACLPRSGPSTPPEPPPIEGSPRKGAGQQGARPRQAHTPHDGAPRPGVGRHDACRTACGPVPGKSTA